MAAVPVGARRAADRRAGATDHDRGRGGADGAGGRARGVGVGPAGGDRVSRPAAQPARGGGGRGGPACPVGHDRHGRAYRRTRPVPGPVLRLAEPAIRGLAGSGLEGRANPLDLATTIGSRGYAAPAVALLLAAFGGLTFVAVRRLTAPGYRRGPAWQCGFAAPPPGCRSAIPSRSTAAVLFRSLYAGPWAAPCSLRASRWTCPAPRRPGPPGSLPASARPCVGVAVRPATAASRGVRRTGRPHPVLHHPSHAVGHLRNTGPVPR